MNKVTLNADGRSWDVGGETFATIKEAMDRRFELSQKAAPKILYFKQDGTPVTKRPSRRAA